MTATLFGQRVPDGPELSHAVHSLARCMAEDRSWAVRRVVDAVWRYDARHIDVYGRLMEPAISLLRARLALSGPPRDADWLCEQYENLLDARLSQLERPARLQVAACVLLGHTGRAPTFRKVVDGIRNSGHAVIDLGSRVTPADVRRALDLVDIDALCLPHAPGVRDDHLADACAQAREALAVPYVISPTLSRAFAERHGIVLIRHGAQLAGHLPLMRNL